MQKKILILGSNGFIGQNIKKIFINKESETNSIKNKYYIYGTNRKKLIFLKKKN